MVAIREDESGTNHSSMLAVFISEILHEANVRTQELDAVAVSAGPGSYTGLRIGVATAKGICFAASRPLIAVDSLSALAVGMMENFPQDGILYCPTVDARRDEIYFSLLDSKFSVLLPSTNIILSSTIPFIIPEQKKILLGGTGSIKAFDKWKNSLILVDQATKHSSKYLIHLAEKNFHNSNFESVSDFEPLYIKPVFITLKKDRS